MPAATDSKKHEGKVAKSAAGGAGGGNDGKAVAQMALLGKAVLVSGGDADKSDIAGFKVVENKRALASADRKAKKAKEDADKKIADLKATGVSEERAKAQVLAKEKNGSDDDAAPAKLRAPNSKKKKSKKSSGSRVSISSAGQLAQLITNILDSTPMGTRPQVSYLGDRIQDMTNQSWNKKYKPLYGSLREFVAARPEFVITDTQVVMTKTDYDAKRASVTVPGKKKKSRSAAAAAAAAAATGDASPRSAAAGALSPSKSGGSRGKRFRAEMAKAGADGSDDDGDGVGSTLRIVFIVLLVLVVLLAVLLSLDTQLSTTARHGIDRLFNLQWN
jgi:hypothetical protein